MNRIIYGPVSSWRLGRSLGVDLVSTKGKTCSFDCIYCQLGKTVHFLTERRDFVTIAQLAQELEAVREFSGLRGVVTVYEALKPEVAPLNLEETLQRRPKL